MYVKLFDTATRRESEYKRVDGVNIYARAEYDFFVCFLGRVGKEDDVM